MSTGDSCSSSDEEWEDVERLPAGEAGTANGTSFRSDLFVTFELSWHHHNNLSFSEGSPPLQAQEKNSAGLEIVLSTDGSTQRYCLATPYCIVKQGNLGQSY